jgi:hypothetical protein
MSQAVANSRSPTPAASITSSPMWRFMAVAGVVLVLVGLYYFLHRRGFEALPTVYGQRRGLNAADSVNGTSVLAGMFTQAGHKVRTITRLSPRADEFQTIVWFPDDYKPPTEEQRQWLEEWLARGSGRMLVYVGRDYDAAAEYWNDIQPAAPPAQAEELQRRAANARSEYDNQRAAMPESEKAEWFTVERGSGRNRAQSLTGPWADGVDAKKIDIPVAGTLQPPATEESDPNATAEMVDQVETLLASEQDTLATRITSYELGDGKIIVLTNGSFVLNYPLVNHEHRKLAARLVSEAGPGDVAFLESGENGPEILDKEPESSIPSGLQLIKIWPLNVILLHLTMLGIVYCIARWPIFGRAKELPVDSKADFGKHISALGELLKKTKDTAYADARVQQYRAQGKRDSGKSHR